MLSMTENGGIQLFLFLFLFMSGVACSVVEQSLATAPRDSTHSTGLKHKETINNTYAEYS